MPLNWKLGGVLLGLVFFMAVLLVKPIGVSTQFVILDGIVADAVNPSLVTATDGGYTSTNAYLAKSDGKYAKAVSNPLNYSFVFVVAMMLGGFLSAMLRGGIEASDRSIPALWRANFGDCAKKRYAAAFLGGFIVLSLWPLHAHGPVTVNHNRTHAPPKISGAFFCQTQDTCRERSKADDT